MSKQKVARILNQMAQEAAPGEEINLWPGLHAHLQTKSFSTRRGPATPAFRIRRAVLMVSTIILLGLALLVTPQGKTLAQNIFRFFRQQSDVIALPTPAPINLVDPTLPTLQPSVTPAPTVFPAFSEVCGEIAEPECSMDQIRQMVDFPVKGLANIPEGMKFIGATGGPDSVTLVYHNDDRYNFQYISINQEKINLTDPNQTLAIAESAEIEAVTVSEGVMGEYVKGSYYHMAGDRTASWEADSDIQTLRWQDGNFLYTLTFIGDTDTGDQPVGKLELARLASKLTLSVNQEASQPYTPQRKTINEVESITGITILEPSWLPEGYEFYAAEFLPEPNISCLFYRHPGDGADVEYSLSIALSSNNTMPSLEALFPEIPDYGQYLVQENLEVGGALNDLGVFGYGAMDASNYCGHSMQSKVLLFATDAAQYAIYAQDSGPIGYSRNWLTRQEMVRLAESITGTSTLQEGQLDPEFLTSIEDAEQLSGMELKQPATLPEGMVFVYAKVTEADGNLRVDLNYANNEVQISVWQYPADPEALQAFINEHPESYDPITIHGQSGWISQGYWSEMDGKVGGWHEIEDGGDGGATVTWIEDGMRYSVGGFNAYSREVWLAIAESLR